MLGWKTPSSVWISPLPGSTVGSLCSNPRPHLSARTMSRDSHQNTLSAIWGDLCPSLPGLLGS